MNFYHSTGAEDLTLTAGPVTGSASSVSFPLLISEERKKQGMLTQHPQNGADWHLGVLRLPKDGEDATAAEDWYFSGVYIESGTLTKTVVGPASA